MSPRRHSQPKEHRSAPSQEPANREPTNHFPSRKMIISIRFCVMSNGTLCDRQWSNGPRIGRGTAFGVGCIPQNTTRSRFYAPWPIPRPNDWVTRVNRALTKKEREAVQASVARGRPFGSESWQEATAKQLGLESTFRSRGRPKKTIDDGKS